MERVIVTIQKANENLIHDVEIPADMTLEECLSMLVRGLGWDLNQFSLPISYDVLRKSNHQKLDFKKSIIANGILDGDWLLLYPQEASTAQAEDGHIGLVRRWQPLTTPQPGEAPKRTASVAVKWKQLDE